MTKEELEKEAERKKVLEKEEMERKESLQKLQEKEAEKSFEKEGYIGNTKLPNGTNKYSYVKGFKDCAQLREKQITALKAENKKMKCLLKEIYSEYGFSELVKIRNDLPLEIQEIIKWVVRDF